MATSSGFAAAEARVRQPEPQALLGRRRKDPESPGKVEKAPEIRRLMVEDTPSGSGSQVLAALLGCEPGLPQPVP